MERVLWPMEPVEPRIARRFNVLTKPNSKEIVLSDTAP